VNIKLLPLFLVCLSYASDFARATADMQEYRIETDSLGEVRVPKNVYYGAQTARALENFNVGTEIFPSEFIRALGMVKKAAVQVHQRHGFLKNDVAEAMKQAANEVASGKLDQHFPARIWQAAGTQTNMNANEVISNRAIELLGGVIGSKKPVHPNDHVNMAQSTNDVIPSATNIAAVEMVMHQLLPALKKIRNVLYKKSVEFKDIIKIGRTHVQDAIPLSLGQEFSGYVSQIEHGITRIENALRHSYELPIGGTAIGTGMNAYIGFDKEVVETINEFTRLPFVVAENKFEGIAAHDCVVELSGALKCFAVSLFKIVNDIRLMVSGPRCGFGELSLPKNEPGSSIMPGKVNPSQCDMATMVCAQIIGNDTTISMLGAHGHFELSVCGPLMTFCLLQSIRLLADTCNSLTDRAFVGLTPNKEKIKEHLSNSLMLVTALSPIIGYDKAAEVALKAWRENKTLREVIIELGYMSGDKFDASVKPEKMIAPIELHRFIG